MENFNNTTKNQNGNENTENQSLSDWGSTNDYQQSSWGNTNDYQQSGWGNNNSDNFGSDNISYNNTYNNTNNYPQDNYTPNSYKQNNDYSNTANYQNNYTSNYYNQSKTDNSNHSSFNNDSDNSNKKVLFQNSEFTIEMQKPTKKSFSLESYRTPDDPQSAEIVRLGKNTRFKISGWVYFINFILIVICAFLSANSTTPATAKLFKESALLLVGTIFLTPGIVGLIDSIVTPKKKTASCTQPVIASVVDIKTTKNGDGDIRHYPIYKFLYNGKIYILFSEYSSNSIEIGAIKEFYINPNNPDDYFSQSEYSLSSGIIGLIFAVIPMIIMLVIVFKT